MEEGFRNQADFELNKINALSATDIGLSYKLHMLLFIAWSSQPIRFFHNKSNVLKQLLSLCTFSHIVCTGSSEVWITQSLSL